MDLSNIKEQIHEFSVKMLPVTTVIAMITFITLTISIIYACIKIARQKELNLQLKKKEEDLDGEEIDVENQQQQQKKEGNERKSNQNEFKGYKQDGRENQNQIVIQQHPQEEQNELVQIVQKLCSQVEQQRKVLDEKLQKQKNELEELIEKHIKEINQKQYQRFTELEQQIQTVIDEKLSKQMIEINQRVKQQIDVDNKIQNPTIDLDEKTSKKIMDLEIILQKQSADQNEKLQILKNQLDEIIKHVDEKISKQTIRVDERDCKQTQDQIENIKISIQKYEAIYEEDLNTFNNVFMVDYKNNEENQKKVRDILLQLYKQTNQQRQVDDQFKFYVRQVQDKSELKKNYSLTVQQANGLSKYCNAFREVRGDGNCFYTAFGYQFLYILLFHYSFDQFVKFIEKIKKMELSMKIFIEKQDFKIDNNEIEKIILTEFLYRLIRLKSIKDINQRQESFLKQFAAYEQESDEVDSCLYGLSTIFFRNYSNYVIENSEVKDAIDDKINLLIWELECNNNEAVISELAKDLDIYVTLIFFDKQEFLNREYGNKEKQKIILLIKPGHYNIGLLKQETQSEKLIRKNNAIQQESNNLINLTQDYKEHYEQYIQESSNLQAIVTNLLDQLQKGQLPEIEVRKLIEGLSEKQY